MTSKFNKTFELDNVSIGGSSRCVIIAEAGVAHFGKLETAFRLVDLAVDGGADIFKMQHFYPEKLVSSRDQQWFSRMSNRAIPDDWVLQIKKRCEKRGIPFLCTAHDRKALDFLDSQVGVSAFKIGSGEIENWEFIAEVLSRGKPVILSTGMYTRNDVLHVIGLAEHSGQSDLALLHCVTSYPTDPSDVNLRAMDWLRTVFSGPIGYSDHTVGHEIPIAAVARGAQIIEKHITIDFGIPDAQDWKVSCGPDDFADFVESVRNAERAIGSDNKKVSDEELVARKWARKSITAIRDLSEGELLTRDSIEMLRPGDGLSPANLTWALGRSLVRDIREGQALQLEDFAE